ncbi:hypothetical protein [Streptomyces sp. NPDC008125]|uniref:hypothetical protein n=1 Tax=Streptomyces sp. NPDC008125 TaxID=3364811 RepID=UPI0036E000C0
MWLRCVAACPLAAALTLPMSVVAAPGAQASGLWSLVAEFALVAVVRQGVGPLRYRFRANGESGRA